MSLAATVPQVTSLRDFIDAVIEDGVIDTRRFIGRRVIINGGNYMLATVISGVQIALEYREQQNVRKENPVVKNVRLHLRNSIAWIDKKRYRIERTIDHLSYYAGGTDYSDIKVVFKDDGVDRGVGQNIKVATMLLLD
jgi:hypothetical protein